MKIALLLKTALFKFTIIIITMIYSIFMTLYILFFMKYQCFALNLKAGAM